MDTNRMGSFALIILLFVLIAGGVYAYQRSQSDVVVDSPAVRVETNKATGETTVEAPFTRVKKDQNGTQVQAPGVSIDVPNRSDDSK
ncbi:hypothetical protein [Hyphomicrobium sp.]|jgi:hypothetical protein|uniref:hypothetical protein n=1 Tax=Hyphomicrobium sp. TaxID=82 RepID=UPI002C526455|nr:hypothetical protein [Hyphomicrobium sp.]HVZ03132.1 hypothetical protein [Hyphomicrobium sp.]